MFFHIFFFFTMSASSYHQRDIILCLCPYQTKLTLMLLSALTSLFCFYPWPNILKMWTCSCKTADVFSETAHVFCNLFWKICPLFGQILITCLKCFRAFFSPFFYSKKIAQQVQFEFFSFSLHQVFEKIRKYHHRWRSEKSTNTNKEIKRSMQQKD